MCYTDRLNFKLILAFIGLYKICNQNLQNVSIADACMQCNMSHSSIHMKKLIVTPGLKLFHRFYSYCMLLNVVIKTI